MVILITIPWFYPAYKAGGPIQSIANMVEQFSDNIKYKIFTSNTDLDGSVLQVKADKWVKYNRNTEVWYNCEYSISSLKKEIEKIEPDVLFINGIYSFNFNLIPLVFFKAGRKIVSARGMLHAGALSQKSSKKKIYLLLWKMLGLHKKCDFHASTNEEKVFIENTFGKKVNVFVAQNFPRKFSKLLSPEKTEGSLNLLSIALISPMKNHLMIIKSLMKCNGNIYYNVYGPVKDLEYWDTCMKEIKKLPSNIKVIYHGHIKPDQVEVTLSKNHVFILPSKSENFGHAIIEALSAGKPVITSNNTPWNNLKTSIAGINVDPENIEELSKSINFFTGMNNEDFFQWSINANKYSSKAINIDDIKAQYRKMFISS